MKPIPLDRSKLLGFDQVPAPLPLQQAGTVEPRIGAKVGSKLRPTR